MKLKRTSWQVRLVGIIFLLLAGVGIVTIAQPQPASAFGSYLTAAEAQYPTIVGTAIDSCNLCHGNAFTIRNTYGMDYAANGHSFTAIENLDSDGDGFTNIVEINAHTNPGDPNSHPAVATATPTNAPTATPTSVPSATPTNTPTKVASATPTKVASATPTNTSVAPTNTPTRTPSPSPTSPNMTPSPTVSSTQHIEFRGVVKSLPADPHNGDWVVSTHMMSQMLDVTVHVSSKTEIDREDGATLGVGSQVQVEGSLLSDKSVRASDIEVTSSPTSSGKPIEFFDEILSLPSSGTVGTWMVGTYTVNVMSTTHIDNDGRPINVGDFAQVDGILQSDGSVNARSIEIHHHNSTSPSKNYIKFYGDVTIVPSTTNHIGDWTVNGTLVHVSATTTIDLDEGGFPTLPFRAEVKGTLNADGSVDAIQIEVDSHNGTDGTSRLGRASAVSRTTQ